VGAGRAGRNRSRACAPFRNLLPRAAVARLGAKFEGVRRAERIGADGAVRDSAFYSILAPEWPSVKQGLISRLAPGGGPLAGPS
jgi:hypothetical protein